MEARQIDDFCLKIVDKTVDWHPKIPRPKKPRINWKDPATREMLLKVLEDSGMVEPPSRTLLYIMRGINSTLWKKTTYSSLCNNISKWRDWGLMPYGLFADDEGGASYIPSTQDFIVEQIKNWSEIEPWELPSDGIMKVLYSEHEGLVSTFKEWTDSKVPVISCQGQIRHEFLYTNLTRLEEIIDELDGNSIILYVMVDYDKGGQHIYNSLEKWFCRPFPNLKFPNVQVVKYALNKEQVLAAGMPDKHTQLDEWMPLYGIPKLQNELRKLCGLDI
jgi:hypothetical protein